jgi:two-component system phosphate regulon sensor histidine kinase PhoR
MLTTVHDLKAPFTGIESNIQVIKYVHWNTLAEPVKEIIERIEGRSQTLRGRIRQILTLENLRSQGGVAQKQRDVELRSVVDHVLEELGENIRDKRLAIQIDLPATKVHGDEKQLTELFLNLIFNAITYSHEEGKITIQREDVEKKLAVSIRDQGIGIKAEALPHIFEEYYRTHEAQQFNKASTGLGMAIVKEIAVKTHLNISISSEVDKGTTVKVIFPEQTMVKNLITGHSS